MLREIILKFNIFIIYYVITINFVYFLQLVLSAISLYKYIRKIKYSDYQNYTTSSNMIPISILVPAYNEEETIVDNVKSLLYLNYPEFEIIVINDGSKDDTLTKLINSFELKLIEQPIRTILKTQKIRGVYRNLDIPNLVVIDKENGGKADALNAGINVSRYPVFASIDADSVLETDSLVRVIMPFIEDRETIAVGGIVRIANGSKIRRGLIEKVDLPKSKLALFQIIEYLRAFLTGRMGWDALNSLLIVSGAFGAFRKDVAVEVGGYTNGTIGEDMEIIVRLHKLMRKQKRKYKIKFIPDPVCWTQAPENFKDLKSQRRRWQIGLMDSLFRHKEMFLNPQYGMIGLYAYPYFFFFEMLGPIIEVIGYILVPLSYIFGILNVKYFILFFAAAVLYGILLSVGAILLEEYTFNRYPYLSQVFKLTLYAILENFGYRQLTSIYRFEGIFKFSRLKHNWGKIKRTSFTKSA
ncbi:MAG: glycosyltransferase [Caloramator sp.]|nr:glycosyltransferase [Caloramator sp.]